MSDMELRRKLLSMVAIVAACLFGALAISACGSDSDSDDGGSGSGAAGDVVAEAEAAVDKAREPLTEFPGPSEPAGEPPANLSLAVVKVVPAPFPNHLVEGVQEAAEAVGWEAREFTANGTPQGMEQTLETALATKPDALVTAAMPVEFLQGPLEDAKAQGIPVVSMSAGLPEDGKPTTAWNIVNNIGYHAGPIGKVLAQWVIADSPDGAEAIALTSPEFVDIQLASKAFQNTLAQAGSNFSVPDVVESPVTDSAGGQAAIDRMASPLKTNPDANFFFINSESWANPFLQAVNAAGRPSGSVTGLGLDGDVVIPLIKEGQPLVIMGSAAKTYGWFVVDSLIRDFNGKEQPEYDVPTTLVDSENADEYDTDYIDAKYDVAADWQALWVD